MSIKHILFIDTFLLILILLLLAPRLTEIPLHEWIGVLIIPIIFFHLLLSWRWIRFVSQGFLQAPVRTKLNFALNVSLFVIVVLVSVTGLFISRVAVPFISVETIDDQSWHILHSLTLLGLRILIGLHIAMNWKWIVNALRNFGQKSLRQKSNSGMGSYKEILCRILILLTFSCIITLFISLLFGAPTPITNEVFLDPFSRFSGDPLRGANQFMGQIVFLGAAALIGRYLLRVRL